MHRLEHEESNIAGRAFHGTRGLSFGSSPKMVERSEQSRDGEGAVEKRRLFQSDAHNPKTPPPEPAKRSSANAELGATTERGPWASLRE